MKSDKTVHKKPSVHTVSKYKFDISHLADTAVGLGNQLAIKEGHI